MAPPMTIDPGSLDLSPLPSASATAAAPVAVPVAAPVACGAGNSGVGDAAAADARASPTQDAQVIAAAPERRLGSDHVTRSTAATCE